MQSGILIAIYPVVCEEQSLELGGSITKIDKRGKEREWTAKRGSVLTKFFKNVNQYNYINSKIF